MKKIDSFGATAALEWTEGDPSTTTPATRVSADWLNILQAEIVGVIQAAGITLDQGNTYTGGHDTTQLLTAIQSLGIPVGSIQAYGGTSVPSGWLDCNGASLQRTEYPDLFSAIGTAWGTASSAEFNLPDLRGRFLRGRDQGVGVDPDAASRTASNPGGNTGDEVGTVQADAVGSHTHSFSIPLGDNNNDNANPPSASNGALVGITYSGTTGGTGSTETRPKNAGVRFIIKAGTYVPGGGT